MATGLTARHGLSKRAPLWFGPALTAVVCWLGGAHQRGPLAAIPADRPLPFAWFAIEQAIAVGVTVAALGAAAVIVASRLPPLRPSLAAACEARYPLALAAALCSKAVADSFLPGTPIKAGGDGLRLALTAGHWAWLAILAAALVGLQFRAAVRYLGVLRLTVPDHAGRLALAFTLFAILGEATGWMLAWHLQNLFFWPP